MKAKKKKKVKNYQKVKGNYVGGFNGEITFKEEKMIDSSWMHKVPHEIKWIYAQLKFNFESDSFGPVDLEFSQNLLKEWMWGI